MNKNFNLNKNTLNLNENKNQFKPVDDKFKTNQLKDNKENINNKENILLNKDISIGKLNILKERNHRSKKKDKENNFIHEKIIIQKSLNHSENKSSKFFF